VVDVEADVPNEGSDFREGAASDRLAGEDSKPSFDQIEPGSALGREMELDARVLGQPLLDGWCGVSAGVVEDDVQLLAAEASGQRLEKSRNSFPLALGRHLPKTRPVLTSSAAYKLVTPARR